MYEVPVYWSQVGEFWWGINQYHSIKKAPLLIIWQTQQCDFSTCKSIQRSTHCGWVIMNYGRAFNRAAKLIKHEVYLKPENQSKKKCCYCMINASFFLGPQFWGFYCVIQYKAGSLINTIGCEWRPYAAKQHEGGVSWWVLLRIMTHSMDFGKYSFSMNTCTTSEMYIWVQVVNMPKIHITDKFCNLIIYGRYSVKLNYYTDLTIHLTVPRCFILPTVFESIILNGPLQLPAQLTTTDTVIYSHNKNHNRICTHRKPGRTGTGGKTAAACRVLRGPGGLWGHTAAPSGSQTHTGKLHWPGSFQLPFPRPGSGSVDKNVSVKNPTSQRKITTWPTAQPPGSLSSHSFFWRVWWLGREHRWKERFQSAVDKTYKSSISKSH